MPTVSESELEGHVYACSNCPDYEGSIWMCGEGYVCERCFAELAGLDEEDLFADNFDPDVHKDKVRVSLGERRGEG